MNNLTPGKLYKFCHVLPDGFWLTYNEANSHWTVLRPNDIVLLLGFESLDKPTKRIRYRVLASTGDILLMYKSYNTNPSKEYWLQELSAEELFAANKQRNIQLPLDKQA